jgi:hypothetical protein
MTASEQDMQCFPSTTQILEGGKSAGCGGACRESKASSADVPYDGQWRTFN